MTYNNETKIKDLPESHLKLEIESLIKTTLMDFGMVMAQDLFAHTVNRLAYLIKLKYKGFLVGEVKYVFEAMAEHIKGKLSVSTIMQLFSRYQEMKIERQRQEYENFQDGLMKNASVWNKTPMGSAIIHKINLLQSGRLSIEDWDSVKIREVAEKINTGQIKVVRSAKPNEPVGE
jgi:hypothetical protein